VTSTSAKRSTLPEADHLDRDARHAATRMVEVEYVGKMEAVVFRFGDGRITGVPVCELEGSDGTPVRSVRLARDGDGAVIEQFSGTVLEVPWDVVLCHADPTDACPFAPERLPRYRGPDDTDRQRHPA
jgi:hypothetical protein